MKINWLPVILTISLMILMSNHVDMGDIAIRTGRKVTWDPAQRECVNDPEASKLFVRELRRSDQV